VTSLFAVFEAATKWQNHD